MTAPNEQEARPVDYLAHERGYINRHGEALEFSDDDSYLDDDDAYPYGDVDQVCA